MTNREKMVRSIIGGICCFLIFGCSQSIEEQLVQAQLAYSSGQYTQAKEIWQGLADDHVFRMILPCI